jgi:hypothetical protein
MMFTPSRFVVVDDKPAHLTAIVEVFQHLGASCLGVVYNPELELDKQLFMGVRALFLDLHLLEGAATTDHNRHFANLAGILEDNISPGGGPYVLIIWTEHAHLAPDLTRYLEERLDPDRPYARPLAVVSLAKERFINVESGAIRAAEALREAVERAVQSNPQLAALLNWEADVLAAAGSTLSALVGLVPLDQRTTEATSPALDAVLSRLAREAVGRAHVGVDPRSAIASVLAPILADRIINQELSQAEREIWTMAITRHGDRALEDATDIEAGQINRMLHVALGGGESLRSTDWGAVVNFPEKWWTRAKVQELFGVTIPELLSDEFKIAPADRDRCRPRLVRVGAACDHAQNRRGPLTYLFGLEIPAGAQRQPDPTGIVRLPASEWASPRFLLAQHAEPFVLSVNSRYPVIVPRSACEAWQPLYRLREQLLTSLIAHAGAYATRPGIVRL